MYIKVGFYLEAVGDFHGAKFRSEFKWKDPSRFLPTGIFGITSGGGPLISVAIPTVPFLTNSFFVQIREFGKETKSRKSHP